MRVPTDLKNFHAEDDPFQLVSPDFAIALFVAGIILGALLGRYA